MKKVLRIILFITIITSYSIPLNAQVVIEETITTDTIDFFTKEEKEVQRRKHPKLSMLMNLVLPGLGHQYLGDEKRAMVYFTTEALFIFGMFFSESYSRKMYRNSISYAYNYANTKSTKDYEDEYWRIIGNKFFLDYKQYNNVMELEDDMDKKYVEPDETWYWESEYYQENYRDIRQAATRFHVVSSFFLGAMILNRAVSFIDARIASKDNYYISRRKKIDVQPYCSLENREIGVYLTGNF